ncbi:capsular biosynthesis protein [Dyella soli]|uniref:Capsular biosynthesis protein n=1 Tax=Dyella soli TaxID=522319 RepID=A0A4R0YKG8_9GAMM|nr:capsular biosynthesis protein [Dyella soli]TCI08958.1 capsular biosynthesis protein [Dyella soli]
MVHRINFNGADLLDWPSPHMFRQPEEQWAFFVRRFAAERDITDLVLFGDCRQPHRTAIEVLRKWRPSLRIHVFEEGYIRPDWITLERNGVNAHSPLMALRGDFIDEPEAIEPAPTGEHAGASALSMGLHAVASYLAMFFLGRVFSFHEHHRPLSPAQEAGAWLRKLSTQWLRKSQARRDQARLLSSHHPFFLALLQINSDKQVQIHSPLSSIESLLESIIPSFAAHAPADTRLVVKAHPLDVDSVAHARSALRMAKQCGIADRLVFLDGGDLGALADRCRGAVTINSTAGVSVLHRGKPLFVFGSAIYRSPALTHQGSIHSFWSAPSAPDMAHYEAFRRVIIRRSQVNGGFYTRQGQALALKSVALRLTEAPARKSPLPATPTHEEAIVADAV